MEALTTGNAGMWTRVRADNVQDKFSGEPALWKNFEPLDVTRCKTCTNKRYCSPDCQLFEEATEKFLSLERRCDHGESSWQQLRGSDQALVDKAVHSWMDLARRRDHPRACYCLGFVHELQRGVASTSEAAAAAATGASGAAAVVAAAVATSLRTSSHRKPPTGASVSHVWYARAAAKGLAEAQARLARQHRDGRGPRAKVPSDTEALRLFRLAAAQGHSDSYYNAGKLIQRGRGASGHGPDDRSSIGRELIRCAASHDKHLVRAHTALAVARLRDASSRSSNRKTSALNPSSSSSDSIVQDLRSAAQQGYPKAQFNLGILLDQRSRSRSSMKAPHATEGSVGNEKKASSLATAVAAEVNADSEAAEAVMWWSEAANHGHAGAMHNLALRYMQNRGRDLPGMPRSADQATALWLKAAEQKHGPSLCCLGCLVEMGRELGEDERRRRKKSGAKKAGEAANRARALELHQQALDAGHTPSLAHVERLRVPKSWHKSKDVKQATDSQEESESIADTSPYWDNC